jgi:hypothetical protein
MSSTPSAFSQLPVPLLTHIRVQTSAALGVGSILLLTNPTQLQSISEFISKYLPLSTGYSPAPASVLDSDVLKQQQTLTGVILLGIGGVYAVALQKESLDWIELSVVGRVVIAALGVVCRLMGKGWGWSPILALVAVNDGLGGLITGHVLGWRKVFGLEGKGKQS